MRTYFWTSTATVMWCYRCGCAFSYSSQVTCWFSTAQRHRTIRACTIQRWVRCMQGLFMYMDTMYKTYNLRTLNRHTSSHIWKCYQNTSIFLYCLCKLHVICRENGYLMEIYTLDFLKSNSQSPFTIMYWIWQTEQWQYFTYCAQSAYVLYCTVRVHTLSESIEYGTLQYSAQNIHSFALFLTPSFCYVTAEAGKVICCIHF